MSHAESLLVTVLLPIVGLWLATTALVTLGALRVIERAAAPAPPPLAPEVWGAVCASGAAGGGLLGFSLIASSLALAPGAAPLRLLLGITGAGMLLGAAGTVAVVWVVVWLWTGWA